MTDTLLAERRDLVIDRLSSSFATGLVEVDELERRLALAHAASSPAELDVLVTDLVPAPTTRALVPAQRVRVVLGSIERVGSWTVPPHLAVRVACGNLLLDLREARLEPGETTLEVDITMGNVEVIVPPGIAVEIEASSFLGHIEERTERAPGTTTSSLRVIGRVKLGNLELSTLYRGETRRDARWRRRAERRAHRRWRRAIRHDRTLTF